MKKDKISIFTDKHINFTVDIPETDNEWHAGLTYLKVVPENFGMLYCMSERSVGYFHTKDTSFPVDFIFIDWVGNIIKITTAQAFSKEKHTAINARAVLEIKAGECDRLDIREGDTVFYSKTKITRDNEYKLDYYPFKKINHRNYDIVNYNKLYFVAYAEGGAMGWAGSVQFITKENNKINAYMIDSSSLNYEKIFEKVFPPLKYFYAGIAGIGTAMKHPDWKWIDMGFGNHLFVREELYDIFMKEININHCLQGKSSICSPGYIYQNWLYFAYGILKHKKIIRPKENSFGYTINNPIPLSKVLDEQYLMYHLRYEKGKILSVHKENSHNQIDCWSLLINEKGKTKQIFLFMDPKAFKPWRLPKFEEMKLPNGFSFVATNEGK